MKNIEMTAVFEPCDEGGFIAYVQEIPGINTQGETIEEARENLADAVNLIFSRKKIDRIYFATFPGSARSSKPVGGRGQFNGNVHTSISSGPIMVPCAISFSINL